MSGLFYIPVSGNVSGGEYRLTFDGVDVTKLPSFPLPLAFSVSNTKVTLTKFKKDASLKQATLEFTVEGGTVGGGFLSSLAMIGGAALILGISTSQYMDARLEKSVDLMPYAIAAGVIGLIIFLGVKYR